MSIANLKKITICGLMREKQSLLEGLQKLGCLHLLPLRPPPAEVEKVASPRAEAAYKALRFISDEPRKRRQVTRDSSFNVENVVAEALQLKQALRDATDKRDFLENRISQVEPWGDIQFPPQEMLAGYRLWFYVLPLGSMKDLSSVEIPWQIVRTDNRFAYVVLISQTEPPRDLMPVPRTHVGALPQNALKNELNEVEVKIEDLTAERQALTRFIYLLSVNIAEAENRASLNYAEQQTLDDDAIVAVQGWVPEEAISQVEEYAKSAKLACLVEDPGANDEPPTLIEQPENLDAGVDLATFYQVPNYRSWDPSLVLFASFSIFFAMILADAGYGLLLMGGLLLYWKRLGASEKGRAYRILGLALFGSTIIYGVLVGSYFGLSPPEGSVLDRLHLFSVNDFDTMMKLSIIIGVLHIVLANAMVAYTNRKRRTAIASLGWIAALIGGLLLWLAETGSVWNAVAIALLVMGLIAILLFSSERPIRKTSDHLWRLADGVGSLTGAMGAFGDVLSYMRLFALGLASASLAGTFNGLASSVHSELPGLGLLAAILILGIGHGLNLGLSLMSGVVHGLRLNFIEFYKWGLPQEGKSFQKFARKEVQP